MPTYEYVCRGCGHEFEKFQPITAAAVTTCPKCKRRRVERKIGIGAGVLFKGGGFYETDYRSDGYRKAEAAEKEVPPAVKPTPVTPPSSPTASPTPATAPSPAPAPKSPPVTHSNPEAKKSAREGRGYGNLKQTAAQRAKATRRASKPARKNKRP